MITRALLGLESIEQDSLFGRMFKPRCIRRFNLHQCRKIQLGTEVHTRQQHTPKALLPPPRVQDKIPGRSHMRCFGKAKSSDRSHKNGEIV